MNAQVRLAKGLQLMLAGFLDCAVKKKQSHIFYNVKETHMKLSINRIVAHSNCDQCNKCPTIFELSNGDFLVQGYEMADADTLIDIPEGERAVRLPKAFLEQAVKTMLSK